MFGVDRAMAIGKLLATLARGRLIPPESVFVKVLEGGPQGVKWVYQVTKPTVLQEGLADIGHDLHLKSFDALLKQLQDMLQSHGISLQGARQLTQYQWPSSTADLSTLWQIMGTFAIGAVAAATIYAVKGNRSNAQTSENQQ